MNYWEECIKEAFAECEIKASEQQIKYVIEWVEGAHENYGMATGQEFIPNPMNSEVDALKAEIKKLKAIQDSIVTSYAEKYRVNQADVTLSENGSLSIKRY